MSADFDDIRADYTMAIAHMADAAAKLRAANLPSWAEDLDLIQAEIENDRVLLDAMAQVTAEIEADNAKKEAAEDES